MNTGHLESFTGLVQLIIIIILIILIDTTTMTTDTQHYIGRVDTATRWIVSLNIFSDCKRYVFSSIFYWRRLVSLAYLVARSQFSNEPPPAPPPQSTVHSPSSEVRLGSTLLAPPPSKRVCSDAVWPHITANLTSCVVGWQLHILPPPGSPPGHIKLTFLVIVVTI